MRYLLILLLLAGCSNIFDTEEAKISELERVAYANRQFDRKNVEIDYVFSSNVAEECKRRGLVMASYVISGQTLNTTTVRGCAVMSEPCMVVLSYSPTKAEVREEQLHCQYGDWHKAKK